MEVVMKSTEEVLVIHHRELNIALIRARGKWEIDHSWRAARPRAGGNG
jgi:hypothetical protein